MKNLSQIGSVRPLSLAIFWMVAAYSSTLAHAEEIESRTPEYDFRVAFPVSPLFDAFRELSGVRYEGQIRAFFGRKCNIDVDLVSVSPTAATAIDLIDGSSSFELDLDLNLAANGDDVCTNINITGRCRATTQIGDLSMPSVGIGRCQLDIQWGLENAERAARTIEFDVAIPPIFRNSLSREVTLGARRDDGTQNVDLVFGKFDGTNFEVSPTPKSRVIPVRGSMLGLRGDYELLNLRNPSLSVKSPSHMVADVTVGTPYAIKISDLDDAIEHLEDGLGDAVNEVVLALRTSAFGQHSSSGVIDGVFGALLPIQITGEQQLNDRLSAKYELILSNTKIGLAHEGDEQFFGVTLYVANPRVWVTESGLRYSDQPDDVKSVSAEAVLSLPKISSSGVMSVDLRQLKIEFELESSSFKGEMVITGLEKNISNGEFLLSEMNSEFKIEMPDCIRSSNEDMKPKRPCGESDPSRPGSLSNTYPDKNSVVRLRFDQIRGPYVGAANLSILFYIPVER